MGGAGRAGRRPFARPEDLFPPPIALKGRAGELATLARTIEATAPTRLALVGSGGSGKSVLASALGHRLARRFGGRMHWFRVGAWDYYTLLEILALRFGVHRAPGPRLQAVRRALAGAERLLVFDNHEDDPAMARLLDALEGTPATVLITARRCLLAGVLVFPVTAPLSTAGGAAFPRVARLTRALRWNPLALDMADAIVGSGAASTAELSRHLAERGVSRVRVIDHEDDLPEVSLLLEWAWRRLPPSSRRMLASLAHLDGDHVDLASLAHLARVPRGAAQALRRLSVWHLVQEPVRGRYALHAVVRYAVRRHSVGEPDRLFEHFVSLLERHPERLAIEQSHLFGAMDHAHRTGDLSAMLRIGELLHRLD